MSKIEVDAIDKQSGSTVTIGGSGTNVVLGTCGQTVSLGTGATQSGFGRTGTVDWQTSIKTAASFTAVNGEGYFVDTSSNAVTANLPAGSVGAIVSFKDYAQNFDTNALTIAANGSEKIEGITNDLVLSTEGLAVTLVYGDATKGWQAVNSNEITNSIKFIAATGGTVTTVCTNFKVHTFTGPGTFCVSCAGTAGGSNTVSYMVVAGGGGGGGNDAVAGGGAGGFREGLGLNDSYTGSPLRAPTGVTVPVQAYPIIVGGGGAGHPATPSPDSRGTSGSNSVFSTITSTGGGGGAGGPSTVPTSVATGRPGGSGGGGAVNNNDGGGKPGGTGNTPSVTPPQGNPGGTGASDATSYMVGGGGGGATAAGESMTNPVPTGDTAGVGGAGATTSINTTPTAYAGGGGGGGHNAGQGPGAGGAGGGGAGGKPGAAVAGTTNRGGGGGGGGDPGIAGAAGGSGIVIIRYKFQ